MSISSLSSLNSYSYTPVNAVGTNPATAKTENQTAANNVSSNSTPVPPAQGTDSDGDHDGSGFNATA